mgnify:CR=1 FL=1
MPSCGRVNSSKGSAAPKDFLRRSRDGKGLDYKILRWCEYVAIFKAVKTKYQLTNTNKAGLRVSPQTLWPQCSVGDVRAWIYATHDCLEDNGL